MTTGAAGSDLRRLPLSDLALDWRNPRLPDDVQREDITQEELALYIDKHYDPLQIALSVARHGYFESEPLIAMRQGGKAVVVEGNRRLTALMGLADSDLRSKFVGQNSGWSEIPENADLPPDYPVVMVPNRNSVVPLLGFRHISGIAPWEPWAQARFIAGLVEEGQTLEEIASLVGRSLTEVRSTYRDHEILRQAATQFSLDTSRAESNFGVFTAAMGRTKLRAYIEAPSPRDVETDFWPLPVDSKPKVNKLLTYIFGDQRGEGRVVHDSRNLKDLADVLSDNSGTAERVLQKTKSLIEASQAIQETNSQFKNYIDSASRSLRLAQTLDVPSIEPASARKLQQIQRTVEILLRTPSSESVQ